MSIEDDKYYDEINKVEDKSLRLKLITEYNLNKHFTNFIKSISNSSYLRIPSVNDLIFNVLPNKQKVYYKHKEELWSGEINLVEYQYIDKLVKEVQLCFKTQKSLIDSISENVLVIQTVERHTNDKITLWKQTGDALYTSRLPKLIDSLYTRWLPLGIHQSLPKVFVTQGAIEVQFCFKKNDRSVFLLKIQIDSGVPEGEMF